MVDLLGPADAGAINTLTTTTDVTSPNASDTWFQDCADGVSGTGTPEVAKYINRLLQQVRQALRLAGIPLANSKDNMLSWAIQSGFANWIQADFAGSANALTGSAPNAPETIPGGTVVCGIVGTPTNTGATVFNWSGLGAQPVLTAEGAACAGGEIVNAGFLVLRWDGGAWRIVSPPPLNWLANKLLKIDVQTFDATGVWNAPAGFSPASRVIIEIWPGGGGGAPGWGGNGGAYDRFETYLGDLPSSCNVVVGAGGAGSNNTGPANAATAGGASYFAYGLYGNMFTTPGAPQMDNGSLALNTALPNFVSDYVGQGGAGGDPGLGPSAGKSAFYGGGGGGAWNAVTSAPGSSVFGGAGGAAGASGAAGSDGAAPGGGGGAAGVSGTGTAVSGGSGGHGRVVVTTLQA